MSRDADVLPYMLEDLGEELFLAGRPVVGIVSSYDELTPPASGRRTVQGATKTVLLLTAALPPLELDITTADLGATTYRVRDFVAVEPDSAFTRLYLAPAGAGG